MKRKPIIHFKFSITTRLEDEKGATQFLVFAVEPIFPSTLLETKLTILKSIYETYFVFFIFTYLIATKSVFCSLTFSYKKSVGHYNITTVLSEIMIRFEFDI